MELWMGFHYILNPPRSFKLQYFSPSTSYYGWETTVTNLTIRLLLRERKKQWKYRKARKNTCSYRKERNLEKVFQAATPWSWTNLATVAAPRYNSPTGIAPIIIRAYAQPDLICLECKSGQLPLEGYQIRSISYRSWQWVPKRDGASEKNFTCKHQFLMIFV